MLELESAHFHIINFVPPKCWAQADLPIFHSNVAGTSFRLVQRLEMHFVDPDFPDFVGFFGTFSEDVAATSGGVSGRRQ